MAEGPSVMESTVPSKRICLEYSRDISSCDHKTEFKCFVGTPEMLSGSNSCSSRGSVGADGSQTCDSGFSEMTPPHFDYDILSQPQQQCGVKRSCPSSDDECMPSLHRATGHSHHMGPSTSAMQFGAGASTAPTPTRSMHTSFGNGNIADGHKYNSSSMMNPNNHHHQLSSVADGDADDDDNDSVSSDDSHITDASNNDSMDDDSGDDGGHSHHRHYHNKRQAQQLPSGGTSLGVGGPALWVQQQMRRGHNARTVLSKVLGAEPEDIPANITDEMIWRLLMSKLQEHMEVMVAKRERLRHLNSLQDAVRLIKTAKNILVLTGAGVSVSCGIPDFRSRDGIYARLTADFPNLPDPQAMFDIHFFRKDPRPFFKFAREIYPGQFTPSLCHRFIRCLEMHKKLLRNYTQNIDTLEQVAGINNVIQCHGSFATATCQRCCYKVSADDIKDDIFEQRIPLCPHCTPPSTPLAPTSPTPPLSPSHSFHREDTGPCESGYIDDMSDSNINCSSRPLSANDGSNIDEDSNWDSLNLDTNSCSGVAAFPDPIMKPDIVFFGEGLPDVFHESISDDQDQCDLLIVIGSSLKVRPVALIPSSIPAHVPQILINREPLSHLTFDIELLGDCDIIVNELCHRLGSYWKDVCNDPVRLTEIHELPPKPSNSPAACHQRTDVTSTTTSASSSNSVSAGSADTCSAGVSVAGTRCAAGVSVAGTSCAAGVSVAGTSCAAGASVAGTSCAAGASVAGTSCAADASVVDAPHPKNENDIEALRACWAPKVRESVAARLPEDTFLYNGGHRYVFQGAEVYYDPDDDTDEDENDDSSSNRSVCSDAENTTDPCNDTNNSSAVASPCSNSNRNKLTSNDSSSTFDSHHAPNRLSNTASHAIHLDDIVQAGQAAEEATVSSGSSSSSSSCVSGGSTRRDSCRALSSESGTSSYCDNTAAGEEEDEDDMDVLLSNSEHEDDGTQDWMSLHASLNTHAYEQANDDKSAVTAEAEGRVSKQVHVGRPSVEL